MSGGAKRLPLKLASAIAPAAALYLWFKRSRRAKTYSQGWTLDDVRASLKDMRASRSLTLLDRKLAKKMIKEPQLEAACSTEVGLGKGSSAGCGLMPPTPGNPDNPDKEEHLLCCEFLLHFVALRRIEHCGKPNRDSSLSRYVQCASQLLEGCPQGIQKELFKAIIAIHNQDASALSLAISSAIDDVKASSQPISNGQRATLWALLPVAGEWPALSSLDFTPLGEDWLARVCAEEGNDSALDYAGVIASLRYNERSPPCWRVLEVQELRIEDDSSSKSWSRTGDRIAQFGACAQWIAHDPSAPLSRMSGVWHSPHSVTLTRECCFKVSSLNAEVKHVETFTLSRQAESKEVGSNEEKWTGLYEIKQSGLSDQCPRSLQYELLYRLSAKLIESQEALAFYTQWYDP